MYLSGKMNVKSLSLKIAHPAKNMEKCTPPKKPECALLLINYVYPTVLIKTISDTLLKRYIVAIRPELFTQGKLTGWVRQKGPTVIGICCCGDPALVGKAK